jgi:glyoxylase-like metal-dependent hydrolase (beta-lactamase superfamily II)
MLRIKQFTFNPYQENTYVVADQAGDCVIIDPGCYSSSEQAALQAYLTTERLRPVLLLNTHGHIDHMLGNAWVKETFELPFVTHHGVVEELAVAPTWGAMMGLSPAPSPAPDRLVVEGDVVSFGQETFEVLFTPGHSAGHISFYHRESQALFSGDVLFLGSIGRTDLPGGDYDTLMQTIFDKLLPLGDAVKVYSGHGPMTNLGQERRGNAFLREYQARKG